MGPLVPLFWTWDDTAAHGSQSQDEFVVAISGCWEQASNPDHSPVR